MSSDAERPFSFEVYDDFNTPGYSLTEYTEKWITPYGPGENGGQRYP